MFSTREQVMAAARDVAVEIMAGAISAREGAEKIWDLSLSLGDEEFPELDTFVYAAGEWRERPEDGQDFEDGVRAAAADLVRRGWGGAGP